MILVEKISENLQAYTREVKNIVQLNSLVKCRKCKRISKAEGAINDKDLEEVL